MVRAQVTAWSERRSQASESAVIITGMHRNSVPIPPGFSTADHTDTDYAPLFRRLVGHLHGSRIPTGVGGVDIRPGADAS